MVLAIRYLELSFIILGIFLFRLFQLFIIYARKGVQECTCELKDVFIFLWRGIQSLLSRGKELPNRFLLYMSLFVAVSKNAWNMHQLLTHFFNHLDSLVGFKRFQAELYRFFPNNILRIIFWGKQLNNWRFIIQGIITILYFLHEICQIY
jgi:hypothetical protein